ncbi:MAG: hypothetical protein K6T54_07050 [Ignavibacterium sp.]|nr:hypothetical protein [Ignavibacterium sp.]
MKIEEQIKKQYEKLIRECLNGNIVPFFKSANECLLAKHSTNPDYICCKYYSNQKCRYKPEEKNEN